MPKAFEHELNIALGAAREAGKLQRMYLIRGVHAQTKTTSVDLVTEADKASETVLVAALTHAFPEHRIVSEEGGGNHVTSPHVWILDPLDGTTNFAHSYPHFAVSIALQYAGATVMGVVYDVMRDWMFTAIRGQGAWLNGQPIHVSKTPSLDCSLLATGFPYDCQTNPDNNLDHFHDLLMRSHGVLRPGSAALELAAVACGALDGYWEPQLKAWDLAAGALLVTEAGGRVTEPDRPDEDFDPWSGNVVSSNGLIHAELLKGLHPAGQAGKG